MWRVKKFSKKALPNTRKLLFAKRRLEQDFKNLNVPKTCGVISRWNLFSFKLVIIPNEGLYEGRMFIFEFDVPRIYPIDPPEVWCLTKLHHPNIEVSGKVSLNILRQDWNPAFDINKIIFGINLLLAEPDYENAVNTEAWNAKKKYEEMQKVFFTECFKF